MWAEWLATDECSEWHCCIEPKDPWFFDHPIGNVEVVRPRAPHSRLIAVSYVIQPRPSAVCCLVDGVGDENGAAHTCRVVATLFSALHQPVGCWPCQFDSGLRLGAAVCNRRQSRPLYMTMSRLRRQGCGTSILVVVDRASAAYNVIAGPGRHVYRSTAVSGADQTQLRTLTEPSTSRRSASAWPCRAQNNKPPPTVCNGGERPDKGVATSVSEQQQLMN